jgi:hypothetical protein
MSAFGAASHPADFGGCVLPRGEKGDASTEMQFVLEDRIGVCGGTRVFADPGSRH